MSIFPRPLKKVLGKIIPFSLVDLIPTFNLGTGTASSATFLRGDQTWSTVPAISGGGGNNVNYYLNGGTAASVGTYYQMSNTPVIGTGVDFNKSGNGLITQWLTDAGNPNTTEIPAGNWNFEMFMSASSSGGVPKFYMEILKYDGSTFTTIANNSAVPEGITGGTTIDLYLSSVAVPFTSLLITDRLAVRVYIVDNTPGRTITQHTQDSHLCQIITSFSSGISSINTLTKNTQYIVAGTAGSDFNVSSSVDTHTLNLPTASATNRGALKKADWSTFNGKQNQITLTTTGTGAATFVSDVLNIPTPSGGSGLTVGTTSIASGTIGRILFEGTGNVVQEDSALFWDNTNKRLGVGATPASTVRLDIRAQGALSTDIAFRVRNSADTSSILTVNGVGQVWSNGKGAISSNTAFGESSLNSNTTGTSNTAFGNLALKTVTTAIYNSAFGHQSLEFTTGEGNTSFGLAAGRFNTTGINNTYIGNQAGSNGTTASGSIFVGYQAGLSSNATNGIFIGQSASVSGGNGTVAIGLSTGGGSGIHNISIGQASANTLTTGTYNIQIGARIAAASGITTGSNNTLIGGESVIGNVSNNAVLSDGQGNIAIRKDASHFVGVGYSGTATLGAKLDIKAQGALSTDIAFRVRNSADTANLFSVLGNGQASFNATSASIDINTIGGTENPFLNFNQAGTFRGAIGFRNGVGVVISAGGSDALALSSTIVSTTRAITADSYIRSERASYLNPTTDANAFAATRFLLTSSSSNVYGMGIGAIDASSRYPIWFNTGSVNGAGYKFYSKNVLIAEISESSAKFKSLLNISPITSTVASALTPAEGDIVMVSNTNATFILIGLWGYQNGSWAKM